MRFDIFYYDNDIDAANIYDPRRVLTQKSWPVLQMVSEWPTGEEVLQCCDEQQVHDMVNVGALRWEDGDLRFDTPIFLQEDAAVLNGIFAEEACTLANRLGAHKKQLYALAGDIQNGFMPAENLYHILCGMVFDGSFFDALCVSGVVSTSRLHPSGMDYLTIIYQQCPELDTLSSKLLCSWNRLVCNGVALQSFGDSDGARHDFYRAYQLQAHTRREGKFPDCALLPQKEELLAQTLRLVEKGDCEPWAVKLLERYAYTDNGRICVPVFHRETKDVVLEIDRLARDVLLEDVNKLLLNYKLDITAVQHGVDRKEIANELYHILFGHINEALVTKGLVAAPKYVPGEGRFAKSIQMF